MRAVGQGARGATGLRLALAFGAVLATFAIAIGVMLASFGRIAAAEHESAEVDHAKHAGHLAAAMVREQYIHQAHTIIAGDSSHLDHYEEAAAAAARAVDHLQEVARGDEEKRLANEIAQLAKQNHAEFKANVLQAIERRDDILVESLHDHAAKQVTRVVALNEELNRLMERRSEEARRRADVTRVRARVVTLALFGVATALAGGLAVLLFRAITARERDQKLASIGQLAAGVAHEINNPLGVILGYVKLLRRDESLPAAPREELAIIQDEAEQCQRIVQGLLDLARPPRLELEPVDLVALAREAVDRLGETATLDGVMIEGPSSTSSVTTRGDEDKLRQVILNLLTNAAEAAREAGEARVEVAVDAVDGHATLTVADRGPGIPPDILPRIFEPFFTTKRKGTGLGLAIANAIVAAHGGRLAVDSAPERGTRVTMTLPQVPS